MSAPEDVKLLPCPFCGGEAEIVNIDDGENAGGSCVSCTRCLASSNVEFEFKENFVSNWNRRASGLHGGEEGLREEIKSVIYREIETEPHPWDIARPHSLTGVDKAASVIIALLQGRSILPEPKVTE